MIDLGLYLESRRALVNKTLAEVLPADKQPPVIFEAMRYSVEAGGKRLRPLLTIAAAETLGAESRQVVEVACAVELIHTYSLIHDDLPAMDDSDLRRGKPTCHRAYGDAVALLAGDGLLTLAFELLAAYGLKWRSARTALQICAELASAAGAEGMIGGQLLDLAAEGSVLTGDELERIYRLKTGVLLTAAVRCGALAAGAMPFELQALTGFASCLGTAFQITDDLLDREGTADELGKQPGSDQARAKATYPAIYGDQAARKRAEELYREAIASLDALGRPAEVLRELAGLLVFRRK